MFRWIYYTYRNLTYYRIERAVGYFRVMDITSERTLDGTKEALTNGCLATVGLQVVKNDRDIIPWYIPLSKIQKSWIERASEYGYKVGLT